MGELINGKAESKKYKEKILEFVENRKKSGLRVPCIASITVGDDGGSIYYVNNQKKVSESLGLKFESIFLDESISEEELINTIEELNRNKDVDGIMLQLPLPNHIDVKLVTSKIDPNKDIDSLTDINTGKFYKGEKSFIPCTPRSVLKLIKSLNIDICGKNAVVIGRSNIVGKPTAQLLLNENATVTICHSRTKNLKDICKHADIVVSAVGRPGFVTEEFVSESSIVIDVGTTVVDGKLRGDVAFDEVIKKAAYVTPVPGGVGAMTTTMLILNVCEALK
ncbi:MULTISPECIES: bifunctional methylenetetrahydrofolate dehydrogenase/methenyltetrahydrofolate cyclohydrolase [Clostridium]|uniref:bifunctional methylenetetrahydrofolate dehydrogenase/methenyltetrahydrofolate cyclohydrolase n=1 Tax=Clostridium TaxID=1485 RepID=UPI0008241FF2|nr:MULTISPECIES: bifunctional methylenetetrahydrofolate dehydrogenase/methenyltetrahydrofolate cyclohydrolase [Clostridium]PJI09938.1 bifunctional methylenetetrahydrofolate dehydrogenase/methenyltetrahydrofolate cyclohydrolase [Clostridium sp. CT7]